MKKLFKSEQSGRSMIEMLGVLAIIGVLSIAGIAGYSKAMGKFKQQKLADQISTVSANIRTMYASQSNYAGLTSTIAQNYGLIPSDMTTATAGALRNAMGGTATIRATNANETGIASSGFTLIMDGLDQSSCMYIATSDWGGGSSGLVGMTIGKVALADDATAAGKKSNELPLDLAASLTACDCAATSTCAVKWIYL